MTKEKLLSREEVQQRVHELQGWGAVGIEKIHKEYSFKNFRQALDFTNKVGEVAEDLMHHPGIYLTWGKVSVQITNHESGGLTQECFQLAHAIDEI